MSTYYEDVQEIKAQYPNWRSATLPALRLAQEKHGYLSPDGLRECADALGTTATRKFFTITLPGAKYGLISEALVSFTLVMTDFGIPKVIGGNFNMLATDVFKLVIGQQDPDHATLRNDSSAPSDRPGSGTTARSRNRP